MDGLLSSLALLAQITPKHQVSGRAGPGARKSVMAIALSLNDWLERLRYWG